MNDSPIASEGKEDRHHQGHWPIPSDFAAQRAQLPRSHGAGEPFPDLRSGLSGGYGIIQWGFDIGLCGNGAGDFPSHGGHGSARSKTTPVGFHGSAFWSNSVKQTKCLLTTSSYSENGKRTVTGRLSTRSLGSKGSNGSSNTRSMNSRSPKAGVTGAGIRTVISGALRTTAAN